MRALTALALLAAVPAWTATNLGTPRGHPFAFVQAIAVNAHGTAVAIGDEGAGTSEPRQQAFVWGKGRKTALTYRRAHFIEPFAIDAVGDVLGTVGNEAVLWRKGASTSLGAFAPSGMTADGSVVVGSSNDRKRAVVWQGATLTSLPGLGGTEASAYAVNRSGTVVGTSALPSGIEHAVAWRGGVATDLGTVNGLESTADFISASGTIFGFGDTPGDCCDTVVLEWKGGQLIDLGSFGAPGAQPVAMNDHGDVLVQTETGSQGQIGLVLLRGAKTVRIKIRALGRQPLYGVGLDEEDDVVGYGRTRGFMWHDGHATLLPPGEEPAAVAGGWVIASKSSGGAVLLRLGR